MRSDKSKMSHRKNVEENLNLAELKLREAEEKRMQLLSEQESEMQAQLDEVEKQLEETSSGKIRAEAEAISLTRQLVDAKYFC